MFEAKFDKKFKFTNSLKLKHKDFADAKSINLNDLRWLRDGGRLSLGYIFKFAKAKFARLLAFIAEKYGYSRSTQSA